MTAVRITPGAVYLGRPVLVAASLACLRGPVVGTVELPLRLFWSAADRRFTLDDPAERRELYQIVLGEARRPGDLAAFLDGGTLIAAWPGLFLPAAGCGRPGKVGTLPCGCLGGPVARATADRIRRPRASRRLA